MLSSVTKCSVTVLNDIIPGKISFSGERFTVKQSAKQIEIPVERTLRTKGECSQTLVDNDKTFFRMECKFAIQTYCDKLDYRNPGNRY